MRIDSPCRWANLVGTVLLCAACSQETARTEEGPVADASDAAPAVPTTPREIEQYPLRRAFFGDLHVHTTLSTDAYSGGNRVGPRDAYRFARGEAIEVGNGVVTQLATPLDFVALTDHAEGFDVTAACTEGEPRYDAATCVWRRNPGVASADRFRLGFERGVSRPAQRSRDLCPEDVSECLAYARSTWERVQAAANEFDDPGTFTALIGYEFSSLLPSFGMLHRNVVFRGEEVIPHAIASQDVVNQADFLAQLDRNCAPPCEVLTIPHNTNFSWGRAFSRTDEDGSSYTEADLERRERIDRLVEITQLKGNSECQIGVGFADEDCDFGNLFPACAPGESGRCAEPTSFLRNALLDGIQLASAGRPNQFHYGIIGSTDTHNSDPGNTSAERNSRFGAAPGNAAAVQAVFEAEHIVIGPMRRIDVGGLAGVWAQANTRAAIFDALRQRETFGTSGSRLRVRFFAGDLPEDMGSGDDRLQQAYEAAVPMGGDLVGAAEPSFWVWAVHDPDGPTLDRIQLVKGWVEDGVALQRVSDVVCSGGRVPGEDGRCAPTPATVDLGTCARHDASGAAELQARFTDPDYRPDRHAFYYVRVMENPSCRWSTWLANSADLPPPADVPATARQRGWSSPIWVKPE